MFAVFESGGKQHRVIEGEVIRLEKLEGKPGDSVIFDRVMLVGEGDKISVGKPYIDGGKVNAEVLAQAKHKKIKVLKFHRRKNYLRKQGHRQLYTEVRITGISAA
ncbi:MAG: 50S ribosomal protein L21 [Pseudomonadales bacterium]|nr:50S ribosomal protein L21 [Pseudomonadales bacterium]